MNNLTSHGEYIHCQT